MRVVFDSNALVSAALNLQSPMHRAFERALRSETILISEPLLEELGEVLFRPKFDRYTSLADRLAFLLLVKAQSTLW